MYTRNRKFSSRSLVAAAVIGISGVFGAATAQATVVGPNGSVDPLPLSPFPSGSTLEYTKTVDFSLTAIGFINTPNGPLPIPLPVSGSLVQRVYRLADNTITFGYTIYNDDTSQAGLSNFAVRDFSEYTTDLFQNDSSIVTIWTRSVSSASRSADGGSVEFDWDTNLAAGNNSRQVYVRTNATAYQTPGRFFPIASRATVCAPGACVNLYGFAYPVEDSTPPIVSITAPSALACVCNPATITGTAYDPNGFDSYTLEYSTGPNGPWTEISTSSTAVNSNGPLASWNTTSVTQGYYFLRLTAFNSTGLSNSVTSIIFVDKQFDTVDVRSPQNAQILGGGVCFDGTVQDGNSGVCFNNYRIDYAPLPAGSPFNPVNPGTPVYTTPVTNDGLGSWSTTSGGAAVPDGNYRIRVTGTDDCGNSRTVTRDLIIDNTRPVAEITGPASCGSIGTGLIQISGNVSDDHLAGWALQYTGGDAHGWVTIASGNTNVSGVLGTWNTAGLRPCSYTLRLLAGDAASINCGSTNNQTEHLVSVKIGCPGDFNNSGAATVQDIFDFLAAYFAGCP